MKENKYKESIKSVNPVANMLANNIQSNTTPWSNVEFNQQEDFWKMRYESSINRIKDLHLSIKTLESENKKLQALVLEYQDEIFILREELE